jgi:hypothetical protein
MHKEISYRLTRKGAGGRGGGLDIPFPRFLPSRNLKMFHPLEGKFHLLVSKKQEKFTKYAKIRRMFLGLQDPSIF